MKNKKLFAILTLVCFMFTLMPVAAFAAIDMTAADNSYIYAEDAEVDVNENVELTISAVAEVTSVWVWFEKSNNTPNTALVGAFDEDGKKVASAADGIVKVDVKAGKGTAYVQFDKAGEYELHAALKDPATVSGKDTMAEKIAAIADYEVETQEGFDVVVVNADAEKTSKYAISFDGKTAIKDNGKETVSMSGKEANGIDEIDVTFTVYKTDALAETVYAKDIEIDTTSGLDVNDLTVKRDGTVDFDVTVNKAGVHKIYVTIDDFNATLTINAQEGEAEEIELAYVSKTPVNIDQLTGKLAGKLDSYILFTVYDVNGNEIASEYDEDAEVYKNTAAGITKAGDEKTNYVTLTDKPADSKLKSGNFSLAYVAGANAGDGWTINAHKAFDEEGTYSFKVALDNGEYATASIVVKEAGDPVALSIVYDADSVQLGGTIAPKAISWLDANYVSTTLYAQGMFFNSDIDFVVTGTAVEKVDGAKIFVKDDEKYVGSTIKVTVIDEENNLVATKTLTVADEANELAFNVNAVPVDATKKVTVTLVDENGKAVALPNATSASAYVVVMDKPAGADVTVGDASAINPAKGTFNFTFSADTVGVYEVQAVLQVKINDAWRYYTGVQEIKVGATGIEDTVVMSIGANKIVVNDEVVAIDAAPMIKDSRTFVPFRALAEAFGAVVEFDAATQAVVAELDGTKVVMTIGSEVYTVNGVAKTADVAPFISDSRTMVPVRFAAEAFGITVTPIYAEDGSVADVLFTK